MADTIDLTLRADQSPLPNALDAYYSFIADTLRPAVKRPVLNSTVVTFDIDAKAPMYNEEVFRSYSDRLIAASPTAFGMGAANVTDSFSYNYIEMLRRILSQIDASLTQQQLDEIELKRNDIKDTQDKIRALLADIAKSWKAEEAANGYKPTDKDYLDKKIAFYNLQGIGDQLNSYKGQIADANDRIATIRDQAYPDDEARSIALFHRFAAASEYQMTRPQSPNLEADNGYDEIKLAQSWVYGNLGGVFDPGVELRPSSSLSKFLTNKGTRHFSVETKHDYTHNHDSEWGVHGSGGWFIFGGSVDKSQEQHIRHSLSQIRSMTVTFANFAEVWVKRGKWYSSDIFKMKRVKEFLKKNPKFALNLGYVVSTIVLGRGLTITLKFADVASTKEWESSRVDSGGGLSLLGIDLGVSGSYHSYNADYQQHVDTATQTVNFIDDDQHCRLLAFRVEKVVPDDVMTREMTAFESMLLEDTRLGSALLESVISERLPVTALEADKADKFAAENAAKLTKLDEKK